MLMNSLVAQTYNHIEAVRGVTGQKRLHCSSEKLYGLHCLAQAGREQVTQGYDIVTNKWAMSHNPITYTGKNSGSQPFQNNAPYTAAGKVKYVQAFVS